jgi:hypothetical protein
MKFFCLLLSCLLFAAVGNLSAQTDYEQWETSYIKPKAGHTAMFEKAVAEHAKKYHSTDPYKMWVFSVSTGPHSGSYFVALGPVTFTQLGGRPASDEHNADWEINVMSHVDSDTETIFWRMDKDYMYRPEGSDGFGMSRLRFTTLVPGEWDRYEDLLRKVFEVHKIKKYTHAWSVYWRYGVSTGPHVVTELNFSNWAYLDEASTFKKDYDEVHGEGSYERFIEELGLCTDRTKTYDEIITFEPKLSSPQ